MVDLGAYETCQVSENKKTTRTRRLLLKAIRQQLLKLQLELLPLTEFLQRLDVYVAE